MKLLLDERGSVEMRRYLEPDWELVSSSVVIVELVRALRRAGIENDALHRARQVLDRINLRWATEELLFRAGQLEPRGLRAIDALHLASALDVTPLPALFLCYDVRLAEAARLHGLSVLAPGIDEVHEP